MKTLRVDLADKSYDIVIGKGALDAAGDLFDTQRRALIVTDEGVPHEYSERIASSFKKAKIVTLPQGEETKSIAGYERLLKEMCAFEMNRKDCVCAVGGGVVGDLAGFAAASYMRGIDFYNVPTTLLSQVDSSIGGKTAVNLGGIKNVVGAFHQPKAVLIDTDTLKTLPERHISAGLAEAVKMSITSDELLFKKFEDFNKEQILNNIEDIIADSLKIKKSVVEKDEKESGLRKILNFGHTFGHCIEAEFNLGGYYHGECVAMGMLPVCDEKIRDRVRAVLEKLSLPTNYNGDISLSLSFLAHDKKSTESGIDIVLVEKIGQAKTVKLSFAEFADLVKKSL